MRDKLIICWNEPNISKFVMQTSNFYFKSGLRHLIPGNVRLQMHEVSIVVDRINCMKPALTFIP